jgi:hypothetical protein
MALDLVANRVPVAIRNALAGRGGRLIVMHEVDHPDGYVRAFTGTGKRDLLGDGEQWYGLGDLVSVSGLAFSRETKTRNPLLTLGAVKVDQLKFINKKVRGRFARVSLAALHPGTWRVNGDVFRLCVARGDFQDHKIPKDRSSCVIELGMIQPLFIMDRSPNLKWTSDWLRDTYNDFFGEEIVGLDDLPDSAAKQVNWSP